MMDVFVRDIAQEVMENVGVSGPTDVTSSLYIRPMQE